MDVGLWVSMIATGLILLTLLVMAVRESMGRLKDRGGPVDDPGPESSGGGGGG